MRLLLKFNLIFLLVFLAGLAASAYVSRNLLLDNAREEVLQHARLTMEKAIAVRSYTAEQINPLLKTQMLYTFLPQSVPAYSAVEVLGKLAKTFPEYQYKEATLNPTNPRDRAVGWEVDIVSQFRNSADLKEYVGQRDTPTGPSLYVARPLRITNPACLQCHSSVEAAPRTMVEKYGPANGFGWQLGEVVGAQMVSVPLAVPMARAHAAWAAFMGMLSAVFVVIAVALGIGLSRPCTGTLCQSAKSST